MKFQFMCFNCFASPSEPIHKTRSRTINENGQHDEQTLQDLCVFSYNQLKLATDNFDSSNKIGEGGFGSVYKGSHKDGTMLAVKVLAVELESMRGEREFISEIAALSDIKHPNLVNLQGCCIDGADRFLIYDYMENNSLAHTLLGREEKRMKFGWEARRDIVLGIASGLAFLHEEVVPHIVHRDIKPSNILLDRNFKPKVSDFGLSRLLRDNRSHISTHVAGTLGYIAPEYAISGRLTRKSDVYSFGVLLLEIISGRSVVDFNLEQGEHYLVQKAWEAYKGNKLVEMTDHTLGKPPEEEVTRFWKVGLVCVQETARNRPKMSVVAKMLSGEIDIQDGEISQPGLVVDFMDIKVGQRDNLKHSSDSSQSATRTSSFF